MKPKFKPGDVVEFSQMHPTYYRFQIEAFGRGPFIVLEPSQEWGSTSIAKLDSGEFVGRFHAMNLERNEFLTAVHKAQKQQKRKELQS